MSKITPFSLGPREVEEELVSLASFISWFSPSLTSSHPDGAIVSHVAVLHHSSALLVKYSDSSQYDDQPGWFLPNDELRNVEHPEAGAKRILREQLGIENATLKLVDVESFIGDNKSWHLIFDFLAFPTSIKVVKGNGLAEAKWFEIDKLPSPDEFAHKGWGRAVLLKHASVAPLVPQVK